MHVLGLVVIEASDAQQVDDLHVSLFVGVDERAHHFLLVFVGCGEVEVEGHHGCSRSAAYVHDAVHACVGEAQRGGREVVHRDVVYGVGGFQCECGPVGVSAEGECAARLEVEVLVYDVLKREFVDAVLHAVGAVHLELAFVVVGGQHVAGAVEVDVVARACIHEYTQRHVGCDVDVEVEVQVGGGFVIRGLLVVGRGLLGAGRGLLEAGGWRLVGDEACLGDGLRAGGVIHDGAAWHG